MLVTLTPVSAEEFEELAALRIEAMRPSLERIGRFEPHRARERFRQNFAPEMTRHIVERATRVGFVAVRRAADRYVLEHLYVRPQHQSRGLGAAVLRMVIGEAETAGVPLSVGALRGSDSNRFYMRHGFVQVTETEWDIYYQRDAGSQESRAALT
jgi:GNAT superfamily N-acetyltransferase